jgi:ribosome-associated translation inhibitor RaiA
MFEGSIDMAKVFSEYGVLGLALFTSIIMVFLSLKKAQKETMLRYESEKIRQDNEYNQMNKLIETVSTKQEKSIEKLCDKLDKLIDSNFDTQALNKQLAVRLEIGDSQVYKAIIGFSEKIDANITELKNKFERHSTRIDDRITKQDVKIDEMHNFINKVYGNKIPLGVILVNKGIITQKQLDEALLEQKSWREK